MGEVIAISTNKGGVLKTSVTVNLAGALSKKKKILIVDTDNQGNCLLSFGKNPDNVDKTVFDVLTGAATAGQSIMKVHKNIDMIPANDDMAFFEFDVLAQPKKYPRPFFLLREQLAAIRAKYDYILIDTPPNLGLTQANVLTCADSVIIPFQPEQYSMRSLVKIIKAIRDFQEKHNKQLSILGILATLVDNRTVLHSQILQECRKYCAANDLHMFDTAISRTVRYASSIAFDRLPSTLSSPKAAEVYFNFTKEVLQRGNQEK